ncbi:MAG: hypothetical protein JNL58_27880 [Planctomyces sp.]|nr:hypothetical protein [Planctomyces sp.]
MNIWKDYLLPVMPVVLVIGGLLAARRQHHRPYNLLRGLSVCALCAGCFAFGFVRVGWDKAAVAFLFIFVPTATIVTGLWAEHRRYLSTLPPKDPTDKVQP